MSTRTLIKGAGLGVLLTLHYASRLLSPSRVVVYYHRFPLASVYLAVLLDVLAITLITAWGWVWIRRIDKRGLVLPPVMTGILLLEVRSLAYLWSGGFSQARLMGAAVAVVLLIYALRWKTRAGYEWTARAIGGSLFVCGFAVFVLAPNLMYFAARTAGQEAPDFLTSQPRYNERGPRIVWVLFDELSYDQTYEHRWPGLALPNFDRAATESVLFRNVEPASNYTNVAIPSMLLGRPASRFRSSSAGDLSLYTDDTQKWERFDPANTVFAEARHLGWSSGIAGWANPYCRLMETWLDACYSLPYDDPIINKSNMDSGRGILSNAAILPLDGLRTLMASGVLDDNSYGKNWMARRLENYHREMDHARALIQNSSIRFSFIHLPLPHFPAVYDRKAKTFSSGGSYVDNLALADVALGELLDELKRTPDWSETTLIITSDHSWRPWIWRDLGFWTAEDQAASRRGFDSRPVLLVHLPGQQRQFTVPAKYRAYTVAHLIKAIMEHRIQDPEDLMLQIYTRNKGPGVTALATLAFGK